MKNRFSPFLTLFGYILKMETVSNHLWVLFNPVQTWSIVQKCLLSHSKSILPKNIKIFLNFFSFHGHFEIFDSFSQLSNVLVRKMKKQINSPFDVFYWRYFEQLLSLRYLVIPKLWTRENIHSTPTPLPPSRAHESGDGLMRLITFLLKTSQFL